MLKKFRELSGKIKPIVLKMEIRDDAVIIYGYKKIHLLSENEIKTADYYFKGENFSVKELNKNDLIISGKIKMIEVLESV